MRSKALAGKTCTRSRPSAALRHRAGERGPPVLGDVVQGVTEQARHAHEGADAGEQLLARLGRAGREPLGRARRGQPVVLRRHGGVDHILQQCAALRPLGLCPAGRVVGDEVDSGVEGVRVERPRPRPRRRRAVPRRCGSRSVGLLVWSGPPPRGSSWSSIVLPGVPFVARRLRVRGCPRHHVPAYRETRRLVRVPKTEVRDLADRGIGSKGVGCAPDVAAAVGAGIDAGRQMR